MHLIGHVIRQRALLQIWIKPEHFAPLAKRIFVQADRSLFSTGALLGNIVNIELIIVDGRATHPASVIQSLTSTHGQVLSLGLVT